MQRFKAFLPPFSIFCLALFVRVMYNVTVARGYYPLYDSLAYQSIGFNVLDEHCFCLHPFVTTVYRAPLWPWLIAGISLVVGRDSFYDRFFLCCIGSGTCVLIYLFARDLFGKRIGLVAGVISCIYPALYMYDGWMYTESLYTFLFTAISYSVYRIQFDKGRHKRLWIVCGFLLALLSLTRPNGIIVMALILIWALFMAWRKLLPIRSLRNVALTVFIAVALIAPWIVRNALVSHSFVPIATGDGTVLLGAYNDQMLNSLDNKGSWINPLKLKTDISLLQPFPLYTCNAVCEVQREDISKHAALQWIYTHLSSLPRMLVYHFINFWTPDTREADMPMYRFPTRLSSSIQLFLARRLPIPIFLLAALGLIVILKRFWRELLFPCAMLLLTLGEALAYYGSSRFRTPIEPILILLAAGSLWWLMQVASSRKRFILFWQKICFILQKMRQAHSSQNKTSFTQSSLLIAAIGSCKMLLCCETTRGATLHRVRVYPLSALHPSRIFRGLQHRSTGPYESE
jgi:4-amino-4-deoxy-L-arabinose transferase-like glycosyltransferase